VQLSTTIQVVIGSTIANQLSDNRYQSVLASRPHVHALIVMLNHKLRDLG